MGAMIQIGEQQNSGAVDKWVISTIGLILLSVVLVGTSVWLYLNYQDQKNNVDVKIADAVAVAKKTQADADEKKFDEREKEPNRSFVGPDDYGRVTFDYPKTWSVYISKNASNGGTYEAYLNPGVVPPVGLSPQFALRVTIETKDYDKVLSSYESLIKKGDLKSSNYSVDGINGTRLDGRFNENVRGSAVLFKNRDKTVTIRTDADTFRADFDKLITTIKFNQ
jgi:hypothetical protein